MAMGLGTVALIGLGLAVLVGSKRKPKPSSVAGPGPDMGFDDEPDVPDEPFVPSGNGNGGGGVPMGNPYAPFVNAKAAQEAIQALGFYIGSTGADGDFGKNSRAGLRNFKRYAMQVMQWDGPALADNGDVTPAAMAALSAAADLLLAGQWTAPGPQYSGKPSTGGGSSGGSDGVVGDGWFDWPRRDVFGDDMQNFARALQTLGYVSWWGNLSSVERPLYIEPSKYAAPVKRFQGDYNRIAAQKGWTKLTEDGKINANTVKALAFALKVTGDMVDGVCRPWTLGDKLKYEGDEWTCSELWEDGLWEATGLGRS